MEAILFLIIGLFLLSGPVALILSIIALRRTKTLKSPEKLERPDPRSIPVVAPPHEESRRDTQVIAKPIQPVSQPPAFKKSTSPGFEMILGGQWLTWVGILALFFGTTFFIAVDFGQTALAGAPQVLIGLAIAGIFQLIGHRLCKRNDHVLGLGLLGGGLALLFLASYAAYGFHQILSLPFMMPLLLIVAIIGAIQAMRRNSLTIASINLIGAILTPIILVNLSPNSYVLDAILPYLIAVNLGTVLMGLRRGWAGLPLAAFFSTTILVPVWWIEHFRPELWAFLAVLGSWLVFVVSPWLQHPQNRFWSFARAALMILNGLFFALFCYHFPVAKDTTTQGSILSLLAIFYFAQSVLMKKRRGADEATRLSYTLGATLTALAIPVFFDLTVVTLGWTLLAGNLVLAGLRQRDPWLRLCGIAVLGLAVFRVAVLDNIHMKTQFLLNDGFLVGLAALAVMGWVFWAYHRYEDRLRGWELSIRTPLLLLAVALLGWKLSVEVIMYFDQLPFAPMNQNAIRMALWLFILWTGFGLTNVFLGLRHGMAPVRKLGYGFISLALAGTAIITLGNGVELVGDYVPVFNLPLLQSIALILGMLGVHRWLHPDNGYGVLSWETRWRTPILVTVVLLLFVKISLEILAYFKFGVLGFSLKPLLQSQLALSVVWVLYSGAVIGLGFVRKFKPFRQLGLSLLGLTVLKVFLLDMQALERGYRIAAFVVLGIVLLGISMLYQRERKIRIENEDQRDSV